MSSKRTPCHVPPTVLGYCDAPDDEPHWCATVADDHRADADTMAREARDDWADPWWGRLVFEYNHIDETLKVRTMHPIPNAEETTMTSNNAPKPNTWAGLLQFAIILGLLLAFGWGLVALLKWA